MVIEDNNEIKGMIRNLEKISHLNYEQQTGTINIIVIYQKGIKVISLSKTV